MQKYIKLSDENGAIVVNWEQPSDATTIRVNPEMDETSYDDDYTTVFLFDLSSAIGKCSRALNAAILKDMIRDL